MSKVNTSLKNKAHLDEARANKNDEFYTNREDIDKELQHYHKLLKGKVIYCNCDDYRWSKFYDYFKDNFDIIKPKKVIFTCLKQDKKAKKIVITKSGIKKSKIEGTGSYDSKESIKILKSADVVITNPPYSLYREYIDLLDNHKKDYLLVGPMGSIIYRDIQPLVIDNKMNIGYTILGPFRDTVGNKVLGAPSLWFTSLDIDTSVKHFELTKSITDSKPVFYDDENILSVSKYRDIPYDYSGFMGVPISFMRHFDRNQFDIIKIRKGFNGKDLQINDKVVFNRVIIKRKTNAYPNKNSKQKS